MLRRTILVHGCLALFVLACAASHTQAADAFYSARVADVELTEGKLVEYNAMPEQPFLFNGWNEAPAPYVALDGDGEAVIRMDNRFSPWSFIQQNLLDADILVRVPAEREITGRLYLPKADLKSVSITRFRIPANKANATFHDAFYQAKVSELEWLLGRNIPGGAWFRHELRIARKELNQAVEAPAPSFPGGFVSNDLDQTYELFSGGRALSENLSLERSVDVTSRNANSATVELSTIKGITIAEIDWTKKIAGKEPKLDPLAKCIPADQHVVFFPSFDAFVRAIDELRVNTTPVLNATEPRAEDARTVARYEAQLGVPLNSAARLLGGQVVKSVAVTGGDTYFRVGTDVAFVLETSQPDVLKELLWTQMKLNARQFQNVTEQSGQEGSLTYASLRSEDRRVSGYVAVLPGAVLLTNSPYQVRRAAAVVDGSAESLGSLKEFVFFRDRYPLAAENETAFLFLSDATIRRWCGPHWRIAGSRRTRDVAVLAELQAAQLNALVEHTVKPGPIYTDLAMAGGGEFALEEDGVRSTIYNTLDFQTPISELAMDKVTQEEAEAYRRWREGYERNWRWAFDPIGMRFALTEDKIAADMTVMPLIGGSDYEQFITVTRGAKIKPEAGDPHDTVLHYIVSVNREALPVRQYAGLATAMAPGAKVDVLAWLGDTISFYADPDPMWAELLNPQLNYQQRNELLRAKGYAVPAALRIDSRSNFQLAAFLTGVRAYVEQTAPGLTAWESLKHGESSYVKIGPTRSAGEEVPENLAIYYGVIGNALVVTLNEDVIKRAIDREVAGPAKTEKPSDGAIAPTWLGENMAVRAERNALEAPFVFGLDEYRNQLQRLSWSNLPILNAWHRRYPDQDPLKLHETFWQAKLVCPGGGEYVWNEEYQTMESTVFGSPAQPKMPEKIASPLSAMERVGFGLTFEEQGLRARAEIERAKPAK